MGQPVLGDKPPLPTCQVLARPIQSPSSANKASMGLMFTASNSASSGPACRGCYSLLPVFFCQVLQCSSPVPRCIASGLLWLQVSGAKRRALHVPGYDKWDGISLEYKVDWPLHLLLTPEVSLSKFGLPCCSEGTRSAP